MCESAQSPEGQGPTQCMVMDGDGGSDDLNGDDGNDSGGVTYCGIGGGGISPFYPGVYGGGSADVVRGGSGDDAVYGEDGWDAIYGGAGNDSLHGGQGNDEIFAQDGNVDNVYGGRETTPATLMPLTTFRAASSQSGARPTLGT